MRKSIAYPVIAILILISCSSQITLSFREEYGIGNMNKFDQINSKSSEWFGIFIRTSNKKQTMRFPRGNIPKSAYTEKCRKIQSNEGAAEE